MTKLFLLICHIVMLLVVCCDGDGPGDGDGWLGPGDVHRAKRAK